jgi:hypothetical protein
VGQLTQHTSYVVTIVTWIVAALLICVGLILFFGLPEYYRHLPGRIPAFYKSVTRRKIILVAQVKKFLIIVVLCRCRPAEFLAEHNLWSKLVLLMERTHRSMANTHSRGCFLPLCLGLSPMDIRSFVKETFMGPTCVRNWPWCPSMVSDALGNYYNWSQSSMGGCWKWSPWCENWNIIWKSIVVVAWRT